MPCSHHQGHVLQLKFTGAGAAATDQAGNFYTEPILEKFPRLPVEVVVTREQLAWLQGQSCSLLSHCSYAFRIHSSCVQELLLTTFCIPSPSPLLQSTLLLCQLETFLLPMTTKHCLSEHPVPEGYKEGLKMPAPLVLML